MAAPFPSDPVSQPTAAPGVAGEPAAFPEGSGEPWVAAVGGCCIRRSPAGGYLVSHQSCPDRHWLMANLPTAHALCADLQRGQYACRSVGEG